MGERGGANLYGFVGNNSIGRFDALGLYEVDVHRFLTEFLAKHAGFCDDSTDIGRATQALDDPGDSRDAMYRLRSGANMRDYHFVSPERLESLKKRAIEACKCSGNKRYKPIGEFLHALEDTYSHSKGVGDRNWDYYGYASGFGLTTYGFGHGPQHHEPDWTWKDAAKADKMAEEVFNQLKELAAACGSTCSSSSWDSIKDKVSPVTSKGTTRGRNGGVQNPPPPARRLVATMG